MDGSSKAVPEAWIERLFVRLSAIYGSKMATMWGDCPKADIMDAWGEALASADPANVRSALAKVAERYPSWPPTLGEFMALCRNESTPQAHRQALPAPWPNVDQAVVATVVGQFGSGTKKDPKDWARRILAEAEVGLYRLPIGIEKAKEALGIR